MAASDAANRLDSAVCSSRLWCSDCQQQQPPLPSQIPITFANAQDYLDVFSPLLLEEAVEGVRSAFEEAARKQKGAAVVVSQCQEQPEGWRRLTLKPATPQDKQQLLQLQRDRDAAVVVLTLQQQQQQQQQEGPVRVTGVVTRWDTVDGQDILLVKVRPWCDHHEWNTGPCCKLYNVLRSSVSTAAVWQLTPAGSTVTSQREYKTLARLQDIQILPYLLNPAAVHAQHPEPQQPADKTLPEEVADGQFKQYLEAKFDKPQVDAILSCAAHVQLRGSTNSSSSGGGGGRGSSDGGGRGSNDGSSSSGGWAPPVTLIQGPPGTGKTYTVLGVLNLWHMVLYHRHYASLDQVVQKLVGADNGAGTRIDKVLLSQGFKAQLALRPRILVCAPSNAATDELLERVMRGGFIDKNANKYNPNIVRLGSEEALSSAAQEVWVEQLAGRLLAMDPHVFNNELQALLQEQFNCTQALENCAASAIAMQSAVASSDPAEASRQRDTLQGVVAKLVAYFERLRVVKVELERLDIVRALVAGPGAVGWARKLQKLRNRLAREQQQQQQQPQQQQQQQQQREEWKQAFRLAPKDIQQQLELSYIENAEMVFTTLSSSSREVFSRMSVPFPLVLLDEAGQATEVASLQPLLYGARGVVMVGDPQQLPATIFSQVGKQLALERSLFERLAEGGCPVSMLRVQYRMHPAIRMFPSLYFYEDALIDADSILIRPKPWYLDTPAAAAAEPPPPPAAAASAASILNPADPRLQRRSPTPEQAAAAAAWARAADGGGGGSSSSLLLPYAVFNVSGLEHSVGRSKANAAEADLAVELYCQLRPALLVRSVAAAAEAAARGELLLALPTDVGIVTPYRGQRDLIRDKIVALFGQQELSRVRVETIDSFQGKQLDVVILSLVRGSNRGPPAQQAAAADDGSFRAGVGFLSDVRRMNVAITRARLSCLILGRVDTLQQDVAWSALVADAAARGCLFKVPDVEAIKQAQQQQGLRSLIQAARQQQEEVVEKLRQQRKLQMPQAVLVPQPAQQQPPQQQQQQQQALLQGGQMGLPARPPLNIQQQQQQQQQATGEEFGRPTKQQKLDHPAAAVAPAAGGLAAAAAAAGLQVNPAAVSAAAAAPAAAATAATAALAAAAAQARLGPGVYDALSPEQAVVAWCLWPKVVELQHQLLSQDSSDS